MEIATSSPDRVLLLGPLQVIQGGAEVRLPPSRKVRALLAYLVMAPRPVTREKLCELLWDVADDPRGELRWCLSKLRPLIDIRNTIRLFADRERVGIDTGSLHVDVLVLARDADRLLSASIPDLQAARATFRGAFLDGLTLKRAPLFENWLLGQRHRCVQLQGRLLERLSDLLADEGAERISVIRERIELAPFEEGNHLALVRALLNAALRSEAEQHIETALKLFAAEGIDPSGLRSAFTALRTAAVKARQRVPAEVLAQPGAAPHPLDERRTRGPTLLVLPFTAASPDHIADADSVTSDIIFGLAKLRSISVIARGTAFSLRDRLLTPSAAAALVSAGYVASGTLRRDGRKYRLTIELADPRSGRIFWADEFACDSSDSFAAPLALSARIVAGLDAEVQLVERNRALLTPPASLDAWQAYHRGLAHMYRFTRDDNHQAQQLFAKAIALDPTFSRSYAGLSFTHFQSVFLLKARGRQREIDLAFDAAGRGLAADPSDPAAHWAMGRALWLRHEDDGATHALDQSIGLSPNYALAHYALAFVQSQTGDASRAIEAADIATCLSPLDPMLFAIHAARTFGLLRLGRIEAAADFAARIGQQPNAHVHAHAIAALTLTIAGRMEEAQAEAARVRRLRPNYSMGEFNEAFHLMEDLKRTYRGAAKAQGWLDR